MDKFDLYFQESELRMNKLLLAYEGVMKNAEINYEAASLKYMSEACDKEDLMDLYTEAKDIASKKSEGILASIWKAIKEFFRKIADFLTGKKRSSKIKDDEKYSISKLKHNFFTKGLSAIKRFFSKIGSAIKKMSPGKIIALAIATIGGFVGIKTIVNKYKGRDKGTTSADANKIEAIEQKNKDDSTVDVRGKDINKWMEEAKKVLADAEKSVDIVDIAAKKDGIPVENIHCVNDIYRAIGNTIKSQCTAIVAVSPVKTHYDGKMLKEAQRSVNQWGRRARNADRMYKKGYAEDAPRLFKAFGDGDSQYQYYKNYKQGSVVPMKGETRLALPDKMAKESAFRAVENGDSFEEFVDDFIGSLVTDCDCTYESATNIAEGMDLEAVYESALDAHLGDDSSYMSESYSDEAIDDILKDF